VPSSDKIMSYLSRKLKMSEITEFERISFEDLQNLEDDLQNSEEDAIIFNDLKANDILKFA
jgi:hypothetical protein